MIFGGPAVPVRIACQLRKSKYVEDRYNTHQKKLAGIMRPKKTTSGKRNSGS
jgi:hypothetical protein